MKHPETICREIAAAIETDEFTYYHGTKPDQNFDADEYTYPCIFLDTPIKAKGKTYQSNFRELSIPVSLFFAYKAGMDQTSEQFFNEIKETAWSAAREFVLRLQKHDDIKRVVGELYTDVQNVFDINVSGCLLEVEFVIKDDDSACV